MSPKAPKAANPIIPGELVHAADLRTASENAPDDYVSATHVLLADAYATETDFTLTELFESRVERSSFQECIFKRSIFADVEFVNCDLSNCDFSEANLTRCIFRSCRLTGATFDEAVLARVEMRDSTLSYATLVRAKLTDVLVTSSDFSYADFSEARQKRTAFQEVQFKGASFFRMKLAGIDLTSCQLKDITLSDGMEELSGCTMDLYQAAGIARRLGVSIKE